MFAYGLAVGKAPYCYGWNKMRILKYLYATCKYDYGKHSFLKLYDLLFMQENLKKFKWFSLKKKFLSLPPLAAFVNSVVLEFHYKLGLNSSVYQNLTCEVFESGLQVVCGALLTNKMLELLVTCLLMIRRGEWEMLIFCISLPAKEKNTEIVCFLPEWMNVEYALCLKKFSCAYYNYRC